MTIPAASPGQVLRFLLDSGVLEPAQLDQVRRVLRPRFPDPHDLSRELLQRGWLTAFQVNQLLQGRGHELRRGPYVLLERLGDGGMGQVYKARHAKLGRIVALKVIHRDQVANHQAVRRFHREIEAMAQLDHPNVVRAFDAGEEGGLHFFAMELVDGTDLYQLVKTRGPLPIAEACDAIRQAALGLQHAHEHGLIHRDIKPSNLLRAARGGAVKLLDLGLARLQDVEDEAAGGAGAAARRDGRTQLTLAGKIVGTPDYMAPEQARDSHDVDIRADLYSLGCTFHFLLSGQVPFPGGSAVEKLFRHHTEAPRPVEQLRPEVPPAVASSVRRLLAKQPQDRYQTPAELAVDLEAVSRNLPGARPAALDPVPGKLPVAVAVPAPGESVATPAFQRANGLPRRRWSLQAKLLAGCVVAGVLLMVLVLARPGGTPGHHQASEAHRQVGSGLFHDQWLGNSVGMHFVRIAPGKFTMGSPETEALRSDDEGPAHDVTITRPFYLGIHEVTQEHYERVMGTNPSSFNAKNGGGPSFPVEQVSWDDAVEFCRRLSEQPLEKHARRVYRLPTEAEWEYACRSGSNAPFGQAMVLDSFRGNFDGNNPYGDAETGPYWEKPAKVGSYRANPWGLYDVHGNVGEWCADYYAADYYAASAKQDPTGPETGERRVWRGGAWDSPGQDCRAAARFSEVPGQRSPRIGFRVVMTVAGQ
jgi:serine/threonine protein kinase